MRKQEKKKDKRKKPQNAYLFHPQQMSIVFLVFKQQHLRSRLVYFWGAKGYFLEQQYTNQYFAHCNKDCL